MDRRTSGRADGSLPQMRYRLCNWIKLRIFNYHGVFGTHVRSLVLSSLLEQCREGHMTRVSTRMLRAGYAPRSAREFTKSTLEGLEGTNRMMNSDRISLLTSAASWIDGESLRQLERVASLPGMAPESKDRLYWWSPPPHRPRNRVGLVRPEPNCLWKSRFIRGRGTGTLLNFLIFCCNSLVLLECF